jgi:DNA-binding response OmpR family regulator
MISEYHVPILSIEETGAFAMSQTKILLISMDDSMSNAIRSCLLQSGYQVIQSSKGAGAVDRIYAEKPDLVILDKELDDYNSLAIIRTLRSHELDSRIPVILVGSHLSEEDVLIGLEVGADLCLLEAFHPQVFIARIRSLLRRSETLKLHQFIKAD